MYSTTVAAHTHEATVQNEATALISLLYTLTYTVTSDIHTGTVIHTGTDIHTGTV